MLLGAHDYLFYCILGRTNWDFMKNSENMER